MTRLGANFDEVFKRATQRDNCYPFQRRFAEAAEFYGLVKIPTGLGKTAMAVLGWLWRRRFAGESERKVTPRRLIYCLPMRVLVEQTRDAVQSWLSNLSIHDVHISVLMGGEETDDWDLHPECDAILIGTQDMLLSRALNRGYGMSRYRWPMHYALLNNDCLWVLDEVQLMGTGLATTTQLQGLRNGKAGLGSFGTVQSIWMSATLEPGWLKTVDFDPASLEKPLILEVEDLKNQQIADRYNAVKILTKSDTRGDDPKGLAGEVVRLHEPGTRTLVVVNTVNRARLLYREIAKRKPGAKLLLIHSRFRPLDRQNKMEQLLEVPGSAGTIVVSTQVVEAGVDLSAKALFTELAPWASLVQRFGRCNRSGEFAANSPAHIYWIDLITFDDASCKKFAPPYLPEDLNQSRKILEKLEGKSAAAATLDNLSVKLPFVHTHVIRRKDVVELFDTTPDLAGNDLDIDRYVRDTDDSDVRVFWRDLGGTAPPPKEPPPARNELCAAPIASFRQFLGNLNKAKNLRLRRAYRRNYLDRKWDIASERDIYPGQVYMLDSQVGGYNSELGWNGEIAKSRESAVGAISQKPETIKSDYGFDEESLSQVHFWRKLFEHTDDVCRELETILNSLDVEHRDALRVAARWHDWGKAHEIFRDAISSDAPEPNAIWAKAPPDAWKRYKRRHFRHELASALALLRVESSHISSSVRNLSVYLVAAHHGKVRGSIRSMPGEQKPANGVRFARGIWEGDRLPSVDLGGGIVTPEATLSLEVMELGMREDGKPSWTEIVLRLRDHLGPFQLAFLELLLRAADMRASSMNLSGGAS